VLSGHSFRRAEPLPFHESPESELQTHRGAEVRRAVSKDQERGAVLALDQAAMGRSRQGDVVKSKGLRTRRNGGKL
jgi:hypothetical protein